MTTKVKPGLIAKGIRIIGKADRKPFIQIPIQSGRCDLIVTEHGDTRGLTISKKVAEVLIANGFPYGS
jgi:hypothetical protein